MSLEMQLLHAGSTAWDETIAGLPNAHLLQTWEWGQVKSRFGWQPFPYRWLDEAGQTQAAALVLRRTITIGGLAARLKVLYVPKGPLLDWEDAGLRTKVLHDLEALASRERAIFVKIDPDVRLGVGVPGLPGSVEDPLGQAVEGDLSRLGWRFSAEQVQFRNTVLIDLRPELDTLLAGMKQKTRYNIRLAERKGVSVRPGGLKDLDNLFHMYAETADRDGFVIRDQVYYRLLWETFLQAGLAEPLIAELDGELAAALVVFRFAGQAWYLNGMSRLAHREKMPNHLLQWEAIRRLRDAGVHTYDLWGAPDIFDESDPLWGVYRFKEGFGGQVARHIGAWDLPVRPVLYRFYSEILPRLLDLMRRRGMERTRSMLS
jgi:lipid II:glycine glycyltransferase (peptidoglycan interpeptide bridge formation enzyme)